ncbi:hypothetical protein F3C99_05280 [Vitellibacter sp. q18]|nr:hypothetical protein [Aequorivita lutea]
MKKIIAITLILITSNFTVAQKCKPKISKVDEMTEQMVEFWGGKIGGQSAIVTGKGLDADLFLGKDVENNNEPVCVLNLTFKVPGTDADIFDINFDQGSTYLIKTEGGIIEMPIDRIDKNKKRMFDNFYVQTQLVGKLTKEIAEKLAKQPVEMFRATSSNGQTVQDKVGEKDGKKLQEQFSCFFERF